MSVLSQIRQFQEDMEGVEILKTTKAYGYYYANLDNIMNVITPKLRKNKLWYGHKTGYEVEVKSNTITTIIYNVDDEKDYVACTTLIDNEATLAKMNRFMTEGSAITYYRRYHLTTMLGLITDEDTDAGGKAVTEKPGNTGRSVEASTAADSKPDFVKIFQGFINKKTKAQITKMFDAYKPQMDDGEIKQVQQLITEKHG